MAAFVVSDPTICKLEVEIFNLHLIQKIVNLHQNLQIFVKISEFFVCYNCDSANSK